MPGFCSSWSGRPVGRTAGKAGGTGERQERILIMMRHPRAVARPLLSTSPFGAPPLAPPAEHFAVQDQVTHDKYGLGWVVLIEDDDAVIVEFGSRKVRILPPFARLTKL